MIDHELLAAARRDMEAICFPERKTTITLPLPPSVNALYRNVNGIGRVRTQEYKKWVGVADGYFFTQKKNIRGVVGKYELYIRIPVLMNGDCDNRIKPVADYLASRGVTSDDRHCMKIIVERCEGVTECEVEVTGRTAA